MMLMWDNWLYFIYFLAENAIEQPETSLNIIGHAEWRGEPASGTLKDTREMQGMCGDPQDKSR